MHNTFKKQYNCKLCPKFCTHHGSFPYYLCNLCKLCALLTVHLTKMTLILGAGLDRSIECRVVPATESAADKGRNCAEKCAPQSRTVCKVQCAPRSETKCTCGKTTTKKSRSGQ